MNYEQAVEFVNMCRERNICYGCGLPYPFHTQSCWSEEALKIRAGRLPWKLPPTFFQNQSGAILVAVASDF